MTKFDPEVRADQVHASVLPVPDGWTHLIHGTNQARWSTGQKVVTMTRPLSAITLTDVVRREEERKYLQQLGTEPGSYDTTRSYAAGAGKPVEVRVAFVDERFITRHSPEAAVEVALASLPPGICGMATTYHEDRHAKIPRGEVLVSVGSVETNDKVLEYFVPATLARTYARAVGAEFGLVEGSRVARALGALADPLITGRRQAQRDEIAARALRVTTLTAGKQSKAFLRAARHELGPAAGLRAMLVDPQSAMTFQERVTQVAAIEPQLAADLRAAKLNTAPSKFADCGLQRLFETICCVGSARHAVDARTLGT